MFDRIDRVKRFLEEAGFTNISKVDISNENVSIHGLTDLDKTQLMDIARTYFELSYFSLDKKVGWDVWQEATESNIWVDADYHHLYFSTRQD